MKAQLAPSGSKTTFAKGMPIPTPPALAKLGADGSTPNGKAAPPPKPKSKLDELSADTGLIDHFIQPPEVPPMPWELPLEERQRMSKDPRVVKHISDVDRWNNTPLEHVWARIRQFAEARRDWVMSRNDVIEWLKSEGITSELVLNRLLDIFDPKDAGTAAAVHDASVHGIAASQRLQQLQQQQQAMGGAGGSPTLLGGGPGGMLGNNGAGFNTSFANTASRPNTVPDSPSSPTKKSKADREKEKELLALRQHYNAIILCKYFELALTTFPYDDLFIQHCFDQFDRPMGSVRLSKNTILASVIKPPYVKGAKGIPKSARKAAAKGPFKMGSGATFGMIEPLQRMIRQGEFDLTSADLAAMAPVSLLGGGGAASTSSGAALPPLTSPNKGATSSNLTPKPPTPPAIGFEHLRLDRKYMFGRAPIAVGHTDTYCPAVLLSMRKNYDTIINGVSVNGLLGGGRASIVTATHQYNDSTNPNLTYDPTHGSPSSPTHPLPAPPSYWPTEPTANGYPIAPDDITFEMFKFAFLDAKNSEWVSAFMLPMLECALKYFAPPHGELPLVSLRWLRDVSAVPISEVQYDADSALLREIEELGYDPWAAQKKVKKGGKGKGKAAKK